jgi:hypothetical protein
VVLTLPPGLRPLTSSPHVRLPAEGPSALGIQMDPFQLLPANCGNPCAVVSGGSLGAGSEANLCSTLPGRIYTCFAYHVKMVCPVTQREREREREREIFVG